MMLCLRNPMRLMQKSTPPVTVAAVQKQVTEFLETRKDCIKRTEEEAKRLQREW
jgi:hypothetical protein